MQSSEHGVQMQKQRRVSNTFGKEKGAKKKKPKQETECLHKQ